MITNSQSSFTLQLSRVISLADCDPVLAVICAGFRSARGQGAAFLHARLSFPSPGMRDFLCEPMDSWHVSQMLFSARGHRASHWLDLAKGRLRLDRLCRNGGGETFFPWASPIPREPRKSHRRHPPLRSGPSGCGVDRLRPADRHRGRDGRGLETARRSDMANIGTFKKSGHEFQGEIVTLSLQTKGVRIVPETRPDQRQRPQPSGLCRPRGDRGRLVEALQRGPRLSLGQARRSELHRSDLRQPLRGRTPRPSPSSGRAAASRTATEAKSTITPRPDYPGGAFALALAPAAPQRQRAVRAKRDFGSGENASHRKIRVDDPSAV